MEIERRFLVKNNDWNDTRPIHDYVWQGYLSFDPERTVRVRTLGSEGFITVKGLRQNGQNEEFEKQISYEDAQRMLNLLCFKPLIQKERFRVWYDFNKYRNLMWEIDVYKADHEGLVIAEIEVPYIDFELELPEWIGEEITDDSDYFNSNLAMFKNMEVEVINGAE